MMSVIFLLITGAISALWAAPINHANFIDLTHFFHNGTLRYPTLVPFYMYVRSNGTEDFGFWLQRDHISTDTHVGTHLDAPCHFAKGRWCVSDIPLERLIAPAIVVDITAKASQDPDSMLTPSDLEEWEKVNGPIPDGSILLLRTGWARRWPNKKEYLGTESNDVSELHFPSFSHEAAAWLAENRTIIGIGLDSVSVDSPRSPSLMVHRVLYDKNIYGLENVGVIDALPVKGTTLYVMPMKIKDASGAPCRILAQLPSN